MYIHIKERKKIHVTKKGATLITVHITLRSAIEDDTRFCPEPPEN